MGPDRISTSKLKCSSQYGAPSDLRFILTKWGFGILFRSVTRVQLSRTAVLDNVSLAYLPSQICDQQAPQRRTILRMYWCRRSNRFIKMALNNQGISSRVMSRKLTIEFYWYSIFSDQFGVLANIRIIINAWRGNRAETHFMSKPFHYFAFLTSSHSFVQSF